ncbi:MAG: ABC transporter permease [Actinomycetota bacterium]|jgi:general nucleoside transport system permease protein|nr:ABC transporter permease [Actinomycetota bacterium]
MNANVWVLTFADAFSIATTLILATIGAILTERSGVINLGVEGILLMGAVTAFLVGDATGNVWLALLLPVAVGAAMALIHATLSITLRANQIVAGLALVIFGNGLSQFIGKPVEGKTRPVVITPIDLGPLTDLPIVGPIIFGHDPITYLTWVGAVVCSLYLNRTRPGLVLRATGDAPATVDAQGVSVARVRFVHTIIGGALMGLAGGWFMLARGTAWSQAATTNGIGWIALALVVFAAWRPLRAIAGAVLFGFTLQVPFTLQGQQINILPPEIVQMLPYLATLFVLVMLSTPRARKLLGAPKMLGQPFVRDER